MSRFATDILEIKYAKRKEDGTLETWEEIAHRVAWEVMGEHMPDLAPKVERLIAERKFMPGGRYLYAAGERVHQTQNCLLLDVEDNKESIGDLYRRAGVGLMTGAGIGTVYSKLRERGAKVHGMGGESTGPCAFMQIVNEIGRGTMQGGSRRAAIWAGLHWWHPDVFEFIHLKDWPEWLREQKEKDFNTPAPMDMTNISVILDDEFFEAYHDQMHPQHDWAHRVYDECVEGMLNTGEPGFSIDVGENAGEHLRNACTEITSADDNDICNLGSLNLANFDDFEDFAEAVDLSTAFLLCGTLYSTVPYDEVAETRAKNRRLGLGIMGLHEWLLKRGYRYEPNEELGQWLAIYRDVSNIAAHELAKHLGISEPIKKRAIAPTGTISIIAETTSGIEPIFCAAFRRRYLKGEVWHAQHVVDAAAKRLIDQGVEPDKIEDAYDLAQDVGRRLGMQAFVQQYVDHGISSTINLPAFEDQDFAWRNEFHKNLIYDLPQLRGITVYPDGARGGQPLTKADLATALEFEGVEFEEFGNENACVGGACGV